MQAITRSVPPQWGQVSMSIANTRLRRCAHWTGCPGAAKHREVRERPAHGCQRLVGIHPTPRVPRYDAGPVFEVGREHAMKSSKIQPRPGHQGGQACDEIERFQHDVG